MTSQQIVCLLACVIRFGLPQVQSQDLIFNELQASNSNGVYDDFFEFDDWVEIHNTGSLLNLAGHFLSDDLDSLDKWKFPDTNPGLTTILPGGHLLIWCDKDPEQGEDHADFSLSGDGETVYLVDTDGLSILDSIQFGQQQSDVSFGRSCDGCDDWIYFDVPTPQASNQITLLPAYVLYLNEWQTVNETTLFDETGEYDSWVELFNPNDFQVNLSGYSLELGSDSYTVTDTEPWLTTVDANGYLVLWLDGEEGAGANHLGLVCPASGGDLSLTGPDGSSIDGVEWDVSTAVNASYGRSLDGSPSWIQFSTPTPRITNSLQIIPGGLVVINEVLSWNITDVQDNAMENEDWIELYNAGDVAVDIAGYYITDRIDNPQKWMVPVGVPDSTVIPSGGFVLLFADDDEDQGWNHMNFKLNNEGEHAALRSPDGFTVLDSLDIPLLAVDVSWGRLYDAQVPWVEFQTTTPNASNGALEVADNIYNTEWLPYPNPSLPGGAMEFFEAGKLYDCTGRLIQSWPMSCVQYLPASEGLFIIQLQSGHSYRILLSE